MKSLKRHAPARCLTPAISACMFLLCCAVSAPGADRIDPDNCLWVLRLPRFIEGRYELKLNLVRHEGRFLHAIGWSSPKHVRSPWNVSAHRAMPDGLRYENGNLTGRLDLTLFPDLWVPQVFEQWHGTVSLEAAMTDPGTQAKPTLRGTYKGTLKGGQVAGTVTGELKPHHQGSVRDFSTVLTVENGWINRYAPNAKRFVLGLDFQDGKAVDVKFVVGGARGLPVQTRLSALQEATWDVASTPRGFAGRVSFTRPDYTSTNASPARYDLDLEAVRAAGEFQGTVDVTMTRDGTNATQQGWFHGGWRQPWQAASGETELQPTCTVRVELVEKCDQPRAQDMAPYTEAIGVYVYRVLEVQQGELEEAKIAVAHWVAKRLLPQPVTRQSIGDQSTLQICPMEEADESLQTVFRSEPASALVLPCFFDCAQELVYPEGTARRWSYRVGSSPKLRLMFLLRDQLKLAALGDCQAWFANRAELYMGEENRTTPVALNLCQKRSGLVFQRLLIETYLMRMPAMEWIVITWNPRWVNGAWAEHGVKGRELQRSPGYQYDIAHLDEVLQPRGGPPLTVRDVARSPSGRVWSSQPWGWLRRGDRPQGGSKGGKEVLGVQEKLGTYMFVPERWAEFESMVENVVRNTGIKILTYTQPMYPTTARYPVKDKLGTDTGHYLHQVRLMRALEEKHAGRFFFYDLNNMGRNGLDGGDFGDIDHVSGRGARRVSERVELYRLEIERLLAATPAPSRDEMAAALLDRAKQLRERDKPRLLHLDPPKVPAETPGRAAFERMIKERQKK
jgi:hypothetical protein